MKSASFNIYHMFAVLQSKLAISSSDMLGLQNRGDYIRINHVDLLRAVLFHCDIPEDKHQHVLTIIRDNKVGLATVLWLQLMD